MSDSVLKIDPNITESAEFLRARWRDKQPTTAIICGSGWAKISSGLTIIDEIPYHEIKCLSQTTIDGHISKLLLVKTSNSYALIFLGRRHYYEGVGWDPITKPVLLCNEIGCKNLILTNAAGGISESLDVGDLMIIEDHINFMGHNPLIGKNQLSTAPRFPDQTEIYCHRLQALAKKIGVEKTITLKTGIYLALSGPAFETPAEIRAYQTQGASAVGMSTVPEAMIANALGFKILGISCITNKAAGISQNPLSHEEVTQTSSESLPKMQALVHELLDKIG
jgi:purine-nucleoside phosphorylase